MTNPDVEAVARLFHETYERLAPQFGYETRAETRTFDPESPNGKLMMAVCSFVLAEKEKEAYQRGREDERRVALDAMETAHEHVSGMDNWQIERRRGFGEARDTIRDRFIRAARSHTDSHYKLDNQ